MAGNAGTGGNAADDGNGGAGDDGGAGGAGGGTGGRTYTEAEVAQLRSGVDAKNRELLGKLKQLQGRVLPEGTTPEEVQAALEFKHKTDQERELAKGNFETLTKQMADKHAKEKADLEGKLTTTVQRMHTREKQSAAVQAINALGASTRLLLPHVMASLKVVDTDDGDIAVRVVDAKGNELVGDANGTPMTPEQFVESLKLIPDFMPAFPPPSAAGGGGRGTSAAGGGAREVVLTAAEARDTARYRVAREQAEKMGTTVVIRG